jgi:hypothetical protein
MPIKFIDLFNNTGCSISRWLDNRHAVLMVIAAFSSVFLFAGWIIDVSKFSPDSWAYFELSKTVFGESFYKFNTVRSYFSNEYSASFPFGYPIALACVQAVIGVHPLTAVIVNICVSMTTIFIFSKICNLMKLGSLTWFAITFSLLFYPGYLAEVFSGRAIPFAVLFFSGAFYAFLVQRLFFSGLLIGVSALVRYDFLVYALLFQFAAFFLKSVRLKDGFNLFGGFIIGILPWTIYSFIHFGKLWVSDNSWLAISALPAHVLDYPAEPIISVLENPIMWIKRVLGNIPGLLASAIRASFGFPLVVVFSSIFLLKWSFLTLMTMHRLALAAFFLFASVAPYIVTGYFCVRYFVLIFLIVSFALLCAAREIEGFSVFGINLYGLIFISLALTLICGGIYFMKFVWHGVNSKQALIVQNQKIASILSYHKKETRIYFNIYTRNSVVSTKIWCVNWNEGCFSPF